MEKSCHMEMWDKKYEVLYQYATKYKRLPHVEEIQFQDGTDMRKWFITQMYRIKNKEKLKYNPLTEEQIKKIKDINKIIELTIMEQLRELYRVILELKRFPKENECYFSNNREMYKFIRAIRKQEIHLTPKEQFVFDKLNELKIRLKKDGYLGQIQYNSHLNTNWQKEKGPKIRATNMQEKINLEPKTFILNPMSRKSLLAYLRYKLHLSKQEMGKILCMSVDNYNHIENGLYELTPLVTLKLIVLIERMEEFQKDSNIKELYNSLAQSLNFRDSLNYLLQKMCALFSLNNGENRILAFAFFKKYRVFKNIVPTKQISIAKQIEIYKEIEKMEEEGCILDTEQNVAKELKENLKQNIIKEKLKEEIIIQTNISLGLSSSNFFSIYTVSEEDANLLINQYETYKQTKQLTTYQLEKIDRCCDLLFCVLNPGQDLSFEIVRLQKTLGITMENFAKIIGVQRTYIIHAITKRKIPEGIYNAFVRNLNQLDSFDNKTAVERFKNCFIETVERKRMKKETI